MEAASRRGPVCATSWLVVLGIPAVALYSAVLVLGGTLLAVADFAFGWNVVVVGLIVLPAVLWCVFARLAYGQQPSRLWAAVVATGLTLVIVLAVALMLAGSLAAW